MDYRAMFKGNYLAAVEFGAHVFTAEIAEVRLVKLEQEDGRTKDKGVVFFKGHDRGWVLCKTNAICVAGMFGTDTTGWVGKRVTLFSASVKLGNEKVPGIRVKGSPDLTTPVEVEVKLPRRKAFKMTLQATGKGGHANGATNGAAQAPAAAAAAPAPAPSAAGAPPAPSPDPATPRPEDDPPPDFNTPAHNSDPIDF